MSEETKMLLAPYRKRIDEIDKDLVHLLRKRYDVIEDVAELKFQHQIDPVLPDRVDEVRENAKQMAKDLQLDSEFIGKLYAQLIEHSCALEDTLIDDIKKDMEKTG